MQSVTPRLAPHGTCQGPDRVLFFHFVITGITSVSLDAALYSLLQAKHVQKRPCRKTLLLHRVTFQGYLLGHLWHTENDFSPSPTSFPL